MLLTEKSTSEKFIVTSDSHTSPNQQLLPLTATINEKNHLVIGGCDVTELVTQFGSPLYILDEKTLRTCAAQYRDGFSELSQKRLKKPFLPRIILLKE